MFDDPPYLYSIALLAAEEYCAVYEGYLSGGNPEDSCLEKWYNHLKQKLSYTVVGHKMLTECLRLSGYH